MNNLGNVQISPVDVEERKKLGIKPGDTVRVWQKIEEKGKTRLQAFEGTVLAVKHGTEPGATFTVRKVSLGVGVEKIFPLYSPMIDKIEVIKRARVRRAKLYFVREKVSKELRRIFRKTQEVYLATKGAAELEEERKRAEEELKKQQEEEAKRAEEEVKKAEEEAKKAEEAAAAEATSEEAEESAPETKEEDAEDSAETKEQVKEDSKEEATEEIKEEQTAEEEGSETDDLTKIEGIGPKIAEALNNAGIKTFADLAVAKDEDVQEIIKDIPGNHKADTWNEQAALARDGKWDELKELQDKLQGGVAKDEDAKEAVEEVEK